MTVALVTRCPHCRMRFRVTSEQLRSHGGMVRCGACREAFNAAESLEYVARTAAAGVTPPAEPALSTSSETASPAQKSDAAIPAPPPEAGGPGERPNEPPAPAEGAAGAAARPVEAQLPEAHDEEDAGEPEQEALATLLAEPTAPGAEPAPEFLRRGPRNGPSPWVLASGCALLAVLLALQCTLLWRAELQARVPPLRPALSAVCALFSCSAQWPMRPEVLAVVSSELQALPGTDALEFDAVIRNRDEAPVALPALELKLTDTSDRTVGQRIFLPADYLRGARTERIEGGADVAVHLVFEPPAPGVSGFYTYLFYP
jgi:predicted Zn finger-like uncharacterized protein